MHSDSFQVFYRISEEILSLTMINLLLQPLVENAILHGIDHRPDQEIPGILKITGKRTEHTLIFEIYDNGAGIPAASLEHLLSEGYGIQNVHNRVQLLYGPQFGLSFRSQPGQGTTVTLTLPVQLPERANSLTPSQPPKPYR